MYNLNNIKNIATIAIFIGVSGCASKDVNETNKDSAQLSALSNSDYEMVEHGMHKKHDKVMPGIIINNSKPVYVLQYRKLKEEAKIQYEDKSKSNIEVESSKNTSSKNTKLANKDENNKSETISKIDRKNCPARKVNNQISNLSCSKITDIFFELDSYVLSDRAKTKLSSLSSTYKKIELIGLSDKVGEKSYNENLATNRAEAVKKHLESLGHKDVKVNSGLNVQLDGNQFRKVIVLGEG
ncbi:hypothetical protein A3715_18405 [Oleiphilus sp. HI0009]|nr:hypothetical protein A3715_18405 [Oleiphilus sp. HI0009]